MTAAAVNGQEAEALREAQRDSGHCGKTWEDPEDSRSRREKDDTGTGAVCRVRGTHIVGVQPRTEVMDQTVLSLRHVTALILCSLQISSSYCCVGVEAHPSCGFTLAAKSGCMIEK